jgi:outer membrane lipoprotein SlyB
LPLRPLLLITVAALALAGCKANYSPNQYVAAAAQQANTVDRGLIVGRRPVIIDAQGTVGAVSGGAAGGIVGSQVPGGAVSSAFGALGGSLVGGLFGAAAEHATSNQKAWEYIVQEPNGNLLSVTQTGNPLPVGLKVLLITGKQARIVPDYTVDLTAPQVPPTATVAAVKAPTPVIKITPLIPPAPAASPAAAAPTTPPSSTQTKPASPPPGP